MNMNAVPNPMQNWLNAIPQDNCGRFYAKVRFWLLPFGIWCKVPVWGQVCDGGEHSSAVGCMLHNEFPFRGRGWKYIAWRSKPDNPHLCKAPTHGIVKRPKWFDPEDSYNATEPDPDAMIMPRAELYSSVPYTRSQT